MVDYYGLYIQPKKKQVFELLGIIPINDITEKLIIRIDPMYLTVKDLFDYVRYDSEGLSYYSKKYLERVEFDDFIKGVTSRINKEVMDNKGVVVSMRVKH
ncbi:hypothetical protein [Neobacillus sp. FSL H8-0543]|uniref:hypothetical protein n=1 Tax=Neobacillus sp. FSL H8-0543 TaxID=2954672 RepID=UPI0031589911